MIEEWFEVAYINTSEAILHGRLVATRGHPAGEVRKTLTDAEILQIEDMLGKHQDEMQKLLRSMA